jgi:hypothetical protein
VSEQMPRPSPMECWGCKGNHRYRDCPHRKDKARIVHNVQQAETVEDMGSIMSRIYAALDNKQAEFQSHMIEVEGMINNRPLIILIHLGASRSYVDPRVVESLHLSRSKHEKSWLVQLATGTKRKVIELVKSYSIDMNGLSTKAGLNVLPLGSYDLLNWDGLVGPAPCPPRFITRGLHAWMRREIRKQSKEFPKLWLSEKSHP